MNRSEIREWLENWLADHLGISPEDVEGDRSLASYGLDSEDLERLTGEVEESSSPAPTTRSLARRRSRRARSTWTSSRATSACSDSWTARCRTAALPTRPS
jgi:hypothetical protein